MKFVLLASAAVLAAAASGAQAQQLSAPGAPVAGVCVYSSQLVLGTSTAGVSANRQLQQLQESITAQLKTTGDQIQADNKALGAQKASLPAAQFQQKVDALRKRAADFESLARVRDAQLNQTRVNAINTIGAAVTPLLQAAINAHRCAIVSDRGATFAVNPAMDLSPEVLGKLNTTLPSVSVQLAAAPAK